MIGNNNTDKPTERKLYGSTYLRLGCGLVSLTIVSLILLPFFREVLGKSRLKYAGTVIMHTPPSTHLSNEDVQILVVWLYFEIKLDKYVQEYNNGNDKLASVERLENLIEIEHRLPTNVKYKPLTDALKVAAHKRIELVVQGRGSEPMSDEVAPVSENLIKYAADIRYTTDRVSEEEHNRILNRYFGSI